MSTYRAQAEILEAHDLALTNSTKNADIKALLEEYGYDQATIDSGVVIYEKARAAYDQNKQEEDSTTAASLDFKNKRDEIDTMFKKDRKKAALGFKSDEATLHKLGLTSSYPRTYTAWMEALTKFYKELEAPELLAIITRYKIDATYLTGVSTDIKELKVARALYIKENGESQQATKDKNKALDELDEWTDELKDTAFIALEETLGSLCRGCLTRN